MGRFVGRASWGVIGLVLFGLWVFPAVVFPHPGINEAIKLSNLELPLIGVELVGLVVALVVFRGPSGTVVRVGLGVFLIGVAIDFLVGLFTFGNMSDDRYAPLLLFPFPCGLAGLAALVVGVVLSGGRRPDLLRGAAYGVAAAFVVGLWIVIRGSRDWLLAPYGFDVLLVIIVLGVALVGLSASRPVRTAAPPG